jgi:signal transduction histidine kinase
MKSFGFISGFFFITCLLLPNNGNAQQVTHFSQKDFTDKGELLFFSKGGWEFKPKGGENWQKVDPLKLDVSIANSDGEIDGLLRFNFSIDSITASEPLSIRITYFGAASVYIDDALVFQQGKDPVITYSKFKKIKVRANQQHCLLIHIQDSKMGFPYYSYRQDFNPIKAGTIRFVNQHYQNYIQSLDRKIRFFYHLWIISLALFSLLFGILFFVNGRNINLLLITATNLLLCTLLSLVYTMNMTDISTSFYIGIGYLNRIVYWSFALALLSTILNLIGVVFEKRSKGIMLLLVMACVVQIIIDVLGFGVVILLFFLVFMFYHIFCQFKFIKGAQWFVVGGIVFVIIFSILFSILEFSGVNINSNLSLLTATGIALSFPVSLFFYLAFRFREINQEVVANAEEVVRLSDEKRLQAESQQELLQKEVARQTLELRDSLQELKATQAQLIHSEKMASLGELTAGIAHEIQNPLNFVNNFAEVNTELIDELETEANKGNLEEVKLLAKDIKENETKINHHGKRADAIVKSMLQHSRKSSGQKELTDINALCDEYLRLSYHGLRAKDKSFNAEFDTNFDTTVAPISVVPQDIGRVILNLINNAFYAVNERQKKDKDSGYKPRVTLTTRQEGNQVVIEVADNGTGMPDQVKEKIFQPFFTTKPTGEGTGLGLSLSYDIVTKGHGGTMEVMTKEGEYTNFVLRIPTEWKF